MKHLGPFNNYVTPKKWDFWTSLIYLFICNTLKFVLKCPELSSLIFTSSMLSSLKHLCPNHFRLFRYSRLMKQCLKRFRIRSFSGPYFTAFGLNTDLKHSKYGHFSSKGFRYFCWGPLDKGWFPLQDFLYIQSVKSARSVLNPEVKAHALPPLEENNKERKINTHIAHILIIFSDWVFLLRKTLDRRETLNEKLGQAGKKEENRKKRKKVIY